MIRQAQLPIQQRVLTFVRGAVNEEARTVEVTFSSETPVERWWGTEVLDHSAGACDLSRLNNSAPLLCEHDREEQIGVVETGSAQIGSDRKGRCIVRFSRNPDGEEEFQDVKDGIRTKISVGYCIDEMKLARTGDAGDEYLITKWTPLEVSLVSIEADPACGVGRQIDFDAQRAADAQRPQFNVAIDTGDEAAMKIRSFHGRSLIFRQKDETPGGGGNSPKVEITREEREAAVQQTRQSEMQRLKEITALGKTHGCEERAEKAINDGETVEAFRKWVLDVHLVSGTRKLTPANVDPRIGMSDKETRSFSLIRALNQIATRNRLEGLEKEACEAAAKHLKRDIGENTIVLPEEVVRFDSRAFGAAALDLPFTRAQVAGTGSGGGFTVATQLGPMIELLRNATVLGRLGVTQLTGLVGDLALPVQTGGATAYWVSETGAVTDSEATFGQKVLTPHRLGASIPFSTQFLAQSSISAEAFIRNELMTTLAIEKDRAGLHGSGAAGQPLGVQNTVGINATVTFGGAADWADVVEFETGCAVDNADIGTMGFALSSATVGKWKTKLKDSVAGAGYLITSLPGGAMEANGYQVQRTNQITGNIAFFGVWAQLIQASWAGMEIIVDPFALKKSGQVEVTINELTDNLTRQPLAFNVSTDSAAQ